MEMCDHIQPCSAQSSSSPGSFAALSPVHSSQLIEFSSVFPAMAAVKPFAFVSDAFLYVSFQILAGKLLLLVLSPTLSHPSVLYGVETSH